MRQDRAFAAGQAISQEAVGKFLAAHFDAIVTVQPHLHRTRCLSDVFGGKPALALGAGHAMAMHMKPTVDPSGIIVGPDEESAPLVRDVINVLGVSWFVAKKQRRGDNEVVVALPKNIAIEGHPVVIVDDIVSSGGTVIKLAKSLKQAGAASINVYAAHALFDQRTAFLMQKAGVSKIYSLSTVPNPTNAIAVVDIVAAGLGVSP
jgi:ribose-phosphate pyrophosphokinase